MCMRMCMYLSMYVQVYYMVLTYVSMHVGPCVHDKDTYVIYLWACVPGRAVIFAFSKHTNGLLRIYLRV